MEKILTSKEREELIVRHRKERDKQICDRIKAVLAYDAGCSYSEMARILLLDDETIRRHIEAYLKDNKLSTANGGSDRKLSDREARELVDHLQEITYLIEVKEFAKELGIKLHYLPPYSPNLNPTERIWKLMNESIRYNQYYGKFSEFADATLESFKRIGRKKCILRARITDNFQILHSPLFAS